MVICEAVRLCACAACPDIDNCTAGSLGILSLNGVHLGAVLNILEDELTVDPARECMEAVSILHGVSISEGCGFESSDKSSGFFKRLYPEDFFFGCSSSSCIKCKDSVSLSLSELSETSASSSTNRFLLARLS